MPSDLKRDFARARTAMEMKKDFIVNKPVDDDSEIKKVSSLLERYLEKIDMKNVALKNLIRHDR